MIHPSDCLTLHLRSRRFSGRSIRLAPPPVGVAGTTDGSSQQVQFLGCRCALSNADGWVYGGDVSPVRVVVAEDNLLVRAGVEALLSTEDGVVVTGVVSRYEELMAQVQRDEPDVVVTDIRMPPTSSDEGIRAAAALRRSHPDVGVVVLSQFLDPAYLLKLIEEGSSRRGYLLKERLASTGQLRSAIHTVAEGGSFIDPLVVDSLVSAKARGPATALDRLTPREMQTLAEVAAGRSNSAIAAGFGVTERAIEKHINSIFHKLGLLDDRDSNRRVCAVLMFLS
ncbi:MAG: response regulator transcription factor [Kribbellaceae bacterium]